VNDERLGSTAAFVAQLGPHLERYRDQALPLPDAAQLGTLVETMFFASLYEEEARRTDFGIAWQPDPLECTAIVALSSPVALTPRNLAKLAPATSGESTAVALRADGTAITAWAILERSTVARQPLAIRALSAGVLRVDYGGVPRALYARGETLLLDGEAPQLSPSRQLSRTFDAWRASEIDLRAAVIVRIAMQVLAHRHGGMILIMPADTATPTGVRVHYPVTDSDVLAHRMDKVVRVVSGAEQLTRLKGSRHRTPDGRVSVRDEAQIAFAETIELIARLTAVDNALLLDTNLRVRGFGVQVVDHDAPKPTFRHTNPYTGESHFDDLTTFKGTRHPAGVIYCLRQPREAAAIIASQDGHLSLVVKHGADVEVIGRYDHAFGWR
jgi:hypothetical protein